MQATVFLIFFGFAGFLLSAYIRHKKGSHERLVCPLNFKCDPVVNSRYSRFLGFRVEELGMAYYGALSLGYGLSLIASYPVSAWITYLLLSVSLGGVLFSVYLTFIQVFALRALCSWCLTSAAITIVIFAIAFVGAPEALPFLETARGPILILHLFGMAIGLGAATVADVLFFRFLKDFRISDLESEVLKSISEVVWLALGIIVLAGLGLYLPHAAELNASPKFLMKMLVVAVIILNGSFLNLLVAPKLVAISFGKKHHHLVGELHRARRLAFALGPVSIVSWYSAFIIASIDWPYGFFPLFMIYLGCLAVAIMAGQVIDARLVRKAAKESA